MRIGIAGPISMKMLLPLFPPGTDFPNTLEFPLIAILAEQFHRRGHEIVVFALSRLISQTHVYYGDRIHVYVCPMRRPRWQMLDFWRGERVALRDAMRMSNCDVIHAHWTYEFGAAAIESGVPHVVTAHDNPMAVVRYARHPFWLEKPFLACPVLRKAQHVTAVSQYVADSLHHFLRPQRDIEVVCNGVDPEVFSLFNKRSARASGNTLVFASALGDFRTRKNARKLIEAFGILRRQLGQRVELWMFGREFDTGGVGELWARAHSLQAGIVFKGPVPFRELADSLATNVDIFVHPSLEEACCMAVIEAMAMGLPVIGGRFSPGVPWLLSEGNAGLLVDVTSAPSIAAGMRRLAENCALRNNLAVAGREVACSRYRLEAAVDRYEEILSRAATDLR